MTFRVLFAEPVRYLPDHLQGRMIDFLVVHTDTAENAKIHAYRTCAGPITITDVQPDVVSSGMPPHEVFIDMTNVILV